MTLEQMIVGARVRLINTVGGHTPGDMFFIEPPHVGTVVAVEGMDDMEPPVVCGVRFDKPHPHLTEWDNVLHVFAYDGDVLPSDFELVR